MSSTLSHSRTIVVIPARLSSNRLPGKLLLRTTGKSVLQHTYEAACRATRPLAVCVATGDSEIADHVRLFGGRFETTDFDLPTGTDRIAQVLPRWPDIDLFVNLQADEPEMPPALIDQLIETMERRHDVEMATIAAPLKLREELLDPNHVKVVVDPQGRALYFSRSPIPYGRRLDTCGTDPPMGSHRARVVGFAQWCDALPSTIPTGFYRHVGIYAYRRKCLERLAKTPRAPLELMEDLEQLRALSAGIAIDVIIVEECAASINTGDDYRRFEKRLADGT